MSHTPGASAPAEITEIDRLRSTVHDMDFLSQEGFSEISAIAKLALMAMEHPDGYRHPEIIAHALRSISGKAEDIENCINSEAEEVGCHYRDPKIERRYAAHTAARQAEAKAESIAVPEAPRPMHVEEAIAHFQSCSKAFASLEVLLGEIEGNDNLLVQGRLISAGLGIAERYADLANRWRDDLKAGGFSHERSHAAVLPATAVIGFALAPADGERYSITTA